VNISPAFLFTSKKAMNKIYLSLAVAAFLFIVTVSVKDFKPALGKWKGTLTYLDYTSGKPYTMPCNITASKDESNEYQLILAFEYPDEPKANGNDTLVISADGTMLDGTTVISKQKNKGVLEIITEKNGVHGNDRKKAAIRHIYSIGKKSFSKRKEVKFDGEEKWILRNEYKMSR
jgi:phage/plasmid primase-like uncharacterized protein